MENNKDLVVVLTTTKPVEAEMAKNVLEVEGIKAEVTGTNQAGLSGALNEVNVLVREKHAEKARKVLGKQATPAG